MKSKWYFSEDERITVSFVSISVKFCHWDWWVPSRSHKIINQIKYVFMILTFDLCLWLVSHQFESSKRVFNFFSIICISLPNTCYNVTSLSTCFFCQFAVFFVSHCSSRLAFATCSRFFEFCIETEWALSMRTIFFLTILRVRIICLYNIYKSFARLNHLSSQL